jgi:hypothetical protein
LHFLFLEARNHVRIAAIVLPALFLAACSGGGSTLPSSASTALTQAQSVVRSPESVAPSNDLLYVGNLGNNSITVYHHDQQSNTGPIRTIAGSKTGINAPGELSEDAAGNLYVANGSPWRLSSNPAILVFAPAASGNVAPIRRLGGPLTGIHNVTAMTVDQHTGKLFVVDSNACGFTCSTLLRFAPNAAGNSAPLALGGSGGLPAIAVASDSTGNNLIYADATVCCSSPFIDLQTFPKQFPNNASLSSVATIGGFEAAGVADDPSTKTYLASGGGITRLAENTVGYTSNNYGGLPASLKPPILSVITSDTCGGQLALGYLRNIYVVHSVKIGGCAADAVYVYTHDAAGRAAPLRVLSGKATNLNEPYGIYEGR